MPAGAPGRGTDETQLNLLERKDAMNMKGTELIRTICFTLCLALGAAGGATSALADDAPMAASAARVDINAADAETLAAMLDGVGVVKAQAIIRYRETHGAFSTVEELANVSGIGLATVDRNIDRISLGTE